MFFRELISNPLYAIVFFLLVTSIGWFLFVKKYPLTKVQWKYVDYFWLPLTAIGVFGVIENNRIFFVELTIAENARQIQFAARHVKDRVEVTSICARLNRGVMSPPDFVEIVRQRELACAWLSEVKIATHTLLTNDTPIIIGDLPTINLTIDVAKETIDDVKNAMLEYNSFLEEGETLKIELRKNQYVKTLTFLSPLILSFAFSVRFVKTMGEINLEEKASKKE